MATPWDRAAAGYLDEWVPRFVPYHIDLVRELALAPGGRVLVASAGPGSEALAVARVVGDAGTVRATDKSDEMIRICKEQVRSAGFTNIEAVQPTGVTPEPGPFAYGSIFTGFAVGAWAVLRLRGQLAHGRHLGRRHPELMQSSQRDDFQA